VNLSNGALDWRGRYNLLYWSDFVKLFLTIAAVCFLGLNLWGMTRAWHNSEDRIVNAETRKEFAGSFVNTPIGTSRYMLEGPTDAPLVVLVGGLTTEAVEYFEKAAATFRGAGYRTLRYDLLGRGGSDRSEAFAYDPASYARQLDELLAALKLDGPVYLVGPSLGGGIAAHWAAEHPSRVRALSLQASAGYAPGSEILVTVLKTPVLGRYLFWLFQDQLTLGRVPGHFATPQPAAIELVQSGIRRSASFQGYRDAIYRTITNFGATNLESTFIRLGKTDIPLQIIWGEDDQILTVEGAQKINGWLGGRAEVTLLPNVGHMAMLEAGDRTIPLVVNFFANKGNGTSR
jgi:pimeloyl-ACP methyl ester carboxylesterase